MFFAKKVVVEYINADLTKLYKQFSSKSSCLRDKQFYAAINDLPTFEQKIFSRLCASESCLIFIVKPTFLAKFQE